MRMNKCAYLFAAALVASTVGMTSCSNEVDDLTTQWEGKTTNAKIAFSLSGLPGTRSSSTDVNMGDAVANIENVAVVPMIGNTPTNPIKFGTITGLSKGNMLTEPEARSLQSTVNRFIVYGNMPTTIYEELSETATPNWEKIQFTPDANGQLTIGNPGVNTDVYKPHGLYYYRDTEVAAPGKSNKGYYTGTGSTWGDVSWGSLTQNAIGNATNIKISDVRYAVGVLATAVFQSDATNNVFYGTNETGETGVTFGNYQTSYSNAPVSVSGIVVLDQNKTLNYDFTSAGTLVPVYDTDAQNGGALATQKLSKENKLGANFYTVVAPTVADKGVGINIEFTVTANKMVVGDKTYTNGEKFYLQATLAPEEAGKSVFAAATSTMLNATVTDWGKATENPQEPTEVNVGIEFDASWILGVVYDIEI